IQFTATPNTGYAITLSSMTFSTQRDGAGATNFAVRSSLDGYASNLATGTNGTTLGNANVPLSGTTGAVTFRIYPYGGSGTGIWRIDDITLNGNILCVQPEVFSVTGGGTYCQSNPSGVPIGVSGSQTGISYQLKRNGTNVNSPIAGNGSAISFLNQTTAGNYTVVGTNTTCSLSATMTGSVTVA